MNEFPDYIFINDLSIRSKSINNIVRTEMGSGLPKTKPIDSTPMREVSFDVSIDSSDLTSFNNWFRLDLKSGLYFFLMRDPLLGVIKRFRFKDTEIEWSKIGSILTSRFILESYDI